ncbi:MAG TPA: hypothetical protein VHA07_10185 [Devosia sp.]|nr:hypothetical protein [Devosia sp.]
MTKFLFAYHGGDQPASPAEGEKVTKAWMDWIGGLGKAMIDPGNPTAGSKTILPGGKVSSNGADHAVTGYSIVEAKSLDDAMKMAKSCPQLAANGTVEVAEIVPIM